MPASLILRSLRPPVETADTPASRSVGSTSFVPGETVSLTPETEAAQFDQSGLGAPGAMAYLRAEGGSTWSVPTRVTSRTVQETILAGGLMVGGAAPRPGQSAVSRTYKALAMEIPQLPRGKYSVWFAVGNAAGPSREITITPMLSVTGRTVKAGEKFSLAVRMVGPTAIPQAAVSPPAARDLPMPGPLRPTKFALGKLEMMPFVKFKIFPPDFIQNPVTLNQISNVGGNVLEVPGERPPITVTTDSSGQAHFTLRAGAGGTSRLSFTAPGFQPVEAVINVTAALPPPPPAPLNGFADLHFHWMSHEAWGGRMFAGRPDGPIETALGWCDNVHGPGGFSFTPEIFHLVGGYPAFDGWPRFTSFFHQQSHVTWVRRAFDNGLRLVSMLAVNNELLPALYGLSVPFVQHHNYPPTDMNAVHRQIAAMRDMAQRHSSWMEIALSAADARRIITANKMAIVLGIEVDSLFWKTETQLREASGNDLNRARTLIQTELRKMYDLGVRQIGPIHFTNNAFGGTALQENMLDFNNFWSTGQMFSVETAPASSQISFRLGGFLPDWVTGFILNPVLNPVMIPITVAYNNHIKELGAVPGGHINRQGLTQYGAILIEEMMKLGMVIDIDHMGEKTTASVLALTGQNYPVVCSHTGFREMAVPGEPGTVQGERRAHTAHEGNKSRAVLEMVRDRGGVVALILDQGEVRTHASRIANDCPGSSKSFAQSYLYLSDLMGKRNIALGSDFGGKNVQIGPRFGTYAAHARDKANTDEEKLQRKTFIAAQRNGVRYTTPINDFRAYRWEGSAGVWDEKWVWEAVALGQSSHNIDGVPMPIYGGLPPRALGTNAWIKDVAKGIRAAKTGVPLAALPPLTSWPHEGYNAVGAYWWRAVQRGAYIAWNDPNPAASSNAEIQANWRDWAVRETYVKVRHLVAQWRAMEGNNSPLSRSVAGDRDFDFNVDGFAHYGLFPDFFQDLKNIGLTDNDLAPLFRSADAYVQMWEKCERNKAR